MKETIETWAVVKHGCIDYICRTEELAKKQSEVSGGTVVRLTGEVPRPLRTVSRVVWIQPMEPIENNSPLLSLQFKLGVREWNPENTEKCTIRARITMQELGDE